MEFRSDEDIVLENGRARLEPLSWQHQDALKDIILKDKDLMHLSTSRLDTESDLEQYIATAMDNRQNSVRYAFAIFDKISGKYAGSTSFAAISNKDRRLEIGFTWIGRDYQGSGLNTTMKQLMLEYAFERLGAIRVEFKTDSRNLRSRRAIEKLGASYEGVLRSHMLLPDGYRRDSVYYSILDTEWAGIKAERFSV